jgi:hypothetical protein
MSERAAWFKENLERVHAALYEIGAARIAVVDHIDKSFTPPERRSYEHWATSNGVLIVATLDRAGRDQWFDVYAPLDQSNRMDNLIAAIKAEGSAT